MARQLSSSTELIATIPASGTGNLTLAAWIYSDTADTGGYPANVDRWITLGGVSNEAFVIRREWNGSTHGDLYVNGTAGGRIQAGTVTAGTWQHWCGTCDGSTIRLYQDGSEVGNVAQTQAPSSQTSFVVGRDDTEGFDGRFAEVAIWTRALTAGEVLGLGKGFSPAFYPQSLLEYWSMVGGSLQGARGAALADTVSSTVGDHTRMYYPAKAGAIAVPAVAAGKATKNIHTMRLGTNLGIRKGLAA